MSETAPSNAAKPASTPLSAPHSAAPSAPAGAGLPKQYQPAEHEDRIRARWDASGAFHADPGRVLSGEREPYCILIPPPNVTAVLHLGHALNNTIQDILTRAHRMKGFETLWLPGTDHAGIATQTMVDKRLREAGEPALADYKRDEAAGKHGRERFVEKVQAWKDEYEARITDQLKQMGCSCDFDRQRFTMDDICARAVREAFFRLFRDGLIYRGKRLVNWDPVTQTALADDEVESIEVDGIFAYMRYPLVAADGSHPTWTDMAAKGTPTPEGASTGDRAFITVATTRPETYFGDTAVAVNPADPRATALRGMLCELPIVGRTIPIIEDDYVVLPDPESSDSKAKMATGFLKVTPAHDTNDYELGQRHEADIAARCSAGTHIINVFAPDATISDAHGWEDVGEAGRFVGLSREDACARVLEAFAEMGLLDKKVPYRHAVGHSYRSHAPIEPYMSDQWYVKVTDDRLRGVAQRALKADQRTDQSLAAWPESAAGDDAGDASMTFHPARYAKTYETWHDNLRDWCISRQLWWGHRIPVWSRPRRSSDMTTAEFDGHWLSTVHGCVYRLTDTHEVICAPPQQAYDVTGDVFTAEDAERELHGRLHELGFTQDPDVLDTWFSSALWPLSTMGWPAGDDHGDTKQLLPAFNPTSVLCTAREIITLWVSRMAMFNRHFLGQDAQSPQQPFDDVFIHAMIQDGDGRKMSKSLGNGVDPLDIIHSHGADAMRYTLAHMTTQTQDVRMPVERDAETGKNTSPKFDLGRNFCNKLWNASRFTLAILDRAETGDAQSSEPTLIDRWMRSRLASATAAIDAALAEYQFSTYATTLYDLLWRDFCDWYLEGIKPSVAGDAHQQATLRSTLDAILRLLHPIAPFITETIYESLAPHPLPETHGLRLAPPTADGLLCTAGWPVVDGSLVDTDAERRFDRVRALVTAIREVRAQHQVPPKRTPTLHLPASLHAELGNDADLIATLAGLAAVASDAPDGAAAAFTFESIECHLSDLADAVDAGAERDRLAKQIADLDKSIKALEGRLNNPGYVNKAPAHLVEQTKGELERAQADRAAAQASLDKLG